MYRGLDNRGNGVQRLVAVKCIAPETANDPELRRTFLEETRVSLGLSHPGIAQTFDYGEEDGTLFIVFEFVHGRSLKQITDRLKTLQRALPIALSTFIVEQAARALAYAHTFKNPLKGTPASIVHRDLSPANVVISFDGVPKLIDFGIAKVLENTGQTRTQAGLIKGKVYYLSPEQIRGEPLDGRSDLFSLGIVFWEILAGRRLFGTVPGRAAMTLIAEGTAPFSPPSKFNPWVPPALDRIVAKTLARDKNDRYQSAAELQLDLYPLLGHENRDSYSLALSMVLKELFDQEIEEEKDYLQSLLVSKSGLTRTLSLPALSTGKGLELPATEAQEGVVLDRKPAQKTAKEAGGLTIRAGVDAVTQEQVFFVEGVVDERADLLAVFSRLGPSCRLNLRGISRINSQGVKLWLQFFRARSDAGAVTHYTECSTAFTHFLGMFRRLGAGTSVASVFAPFACKTCDGYVEYLVQTPDFNAIRPQLQGRVCPACKGPLELAEFPQEYFSFLAV